MMEAAELFDQIGRLLTKRKKSSMFGVSCYKIGRKPFIMLHENQIVCKLLGEVHTEAMQWAGATLSNPMGNDKPMGNWVQIPFRYSDKWEYFAKFAHDLVKNE